MKKLAGLLMLVLIAGLLLLGTASADMIAVNGMDSTEKLAPGSKVIVSVDMKDLTGGKFENFLVDLKYNSNVLGSPKLVSKTVPTGWKLYKGLFGNGRITYFAADEKLTAPAAKGKFTMDFELTVTGFAAKDTPFSIRLEVSGTTKSGKTYVSRDASDRVTLILLGGAPLNIKFADGKGNQYIVNGNKTAAFYKADSDATDVTVPPTVKKNGITFKVTAIHDRAFYKNTKVKTVTVGKNVKTIGKNAFASATALTAVKGNAGLVTIASGAFKGCKVLKSFEFDKNLRTIGPSAFEGCVKLASCTLESKVGSIGARAFYNCKVLRSLTVKSTAVADLGAVGKSAFTRTYAKMTVKVYIKKVSLFYQLANTLVERGANSSTCRFIHMYSKARLNGNEVDPDVGDAEEPELPGEMEEDFMEAEVVLTGWQKEDGAWYYLDEAGDAVTGWMQLGADWYYFLEDGEMATEWLEAEENGQTVWYYLGDNGKLVTGWQEISGKWYYFEKDGRMVTGQQWINDRWEYFDGNGAWLGSEAV